MALNEMTENVEVVQTLSTYPNQEDGLSAEELKAKFDQGPKAIKEYINSQMVPAVRELERVVDPGMAYGLDTTLSVPGRAADAGAVGAALAGKAPAGYGLGGDAQRIDSWNNATKNGFYVSSYGGPDGDGNEWHGIVSNYSTSLCNQFVWKSWGSGSIMATRRIYEGAPEAWEWVNPPMIPGEEYRTTERWNGKAVYTKLIHFGTFNAPAGAEFSIGTIGTDYIPFRWQGYATKTDGINLQIPSKLLNADMYLYEYGGATYIYMSIQPQNFESYGLVGYLRIWYTKD